MNLSALPQRVLNKIAFEPMSGCWLWSGALDSKGYGKLFDRGRYPGAHRFIYETLVGQVDSDLELDHLCRVPCCVNPDHLEPVTHRVNMKRGIHPGGKPQTNCRRGHLLAETAHIWRKANGSLQRQCLECRRMWLMSHAVGKS